MFGADRLLSESESLSRPSGNATGFVIFGPELDAKRLHLLHEITEAGRPIAALLPRGIGGVAARHAAIEAAAAVLGREVRFFEADETGDLSLSSMLFRGRGQLLSSSAPMHSSTATSHCCLASLWKWALARFVTGARWPKSGVRPFRWTASCCGFDQALGVLILEVDGAAVAEG